MQSTSWTLVLVAVVAVVTTAEGGVVHKKRGGCYNRPTMDNRRTDNFHQITGKPLPKSVDWRDKKVVTPVKDQGGCGSCYVFASTGAIEGAHAIKTGKLVSLSEQQVVDCDYGAGLDGGCQGGYPQLVFDYVLGVGGIEDEADYPYTGTRGNCNKTHHVKAASIVDFINIQSGDELALQDAVAHVGPVAVAIDAKYLGTPGKNPYGPPDCGKTHRTLDHAVLVVGYNEEGDEPYWIVKNSWGETWNPEMRGYFRMPMHQNACGIAIDASYPISV